MGIFDTLLKTNRFFFGIIQKVIKELFMQSIKDGKKKNYRYVANKLVKSLSWCWD